MGCLCPAHLPSHLVPSQELSRLALDSGQPPRQATRGPRPSQGSFLRLTGDTSGDRRPGTLRAWDKRERRQVGGGGKCFGNRLHKLKNVVEARTHASLGSYPHQRLPQLFGVAQAESGDRHTPALLVLYLGRCRG